MAEPTSTPRGMGTFFTVWAGQLVSVTGTGISGFGFSLWVFQETGSVTALATVMLALTVPAVVVSPFAGALVDRWDRRTVMLVADAAAGAATLVIAVLFFTDVLEIWHVYVLIAFGSLGNAFQSPAWLATIPELVPKEHLGRANGLVQLNDGLSLVLAPAIAGALLVTVGLGGILVADMVTFAIAVVTLTAVRFPSYERSSDTTTGSLWGDVIAGWRWLRERPGLFGLLWIYGGVNFSMSFGNVLYVPLVLAFASEAAAGGVLSIGTSGAVLGSVIVSAWGGPRHKVRGIMLGIAVSGIGLAAAGLAESLVLVICAAFLIFAVTPVVNTASQVVWQTKVPTGVRGRVFAVRRTIAQAIAPVAVILTGPLADGVFEPLMATDGALAGTIGSVIGSGEGRGIALMLIVTGLMTVVLGIVGHLMPRVRNLETELPDHVEDADSG